MSKSEEEKTYGYFLDVDWTSINPPFLDNLRIDIIINHEYRKLNKEFILGADVHYKEFYSDICEHDKDYVITFELFIQHFIPIHKKKYISKDLMLVINV